MDCEQLKKMAENLEEEIHLVLWREGARLEVVALSTGEHGASFDDAFPLPLAVQAAAAEAEMILDTRTAARLEIANLPEDCWEGMEELRYGECLRVSMLGRAGRKYLALYRAVRESRDDAGGAGGDVEALRDLELSEAELLKMSRWLRAESLFNHQSGDVMMQVLTWLR